MKPTYEQYTEITRKILNTIQVGDLVRINDWKKPLRVKGVSDNYFVMAAKQFKDTIYSVCKKKPWGGIRHNAMTGGMFHCGRDSWIFGWGGMDDYDFENAEQTAAYLQSFESGESEISHRNAVPIMFLQIKRA